MPGCRPPSAAGRRSTPSCPPPAVEVPCSSPAGRSRAGSAPASSPPRSPCCSPATRRPARCSPTWPATRPPCSGCPSRRARGWPAGWPPGRRCRPTASPGSRSRPPRGWGCCPGATDRWRRPGPACWPPCSTARPGRRSSTAAAAATRRSTRSSGGRPCRCSSPAPATWPCAGPRRRRCGPPGSSWSTSPAASCPPATSRRPCAPGSWPGCSSTRSSPASSTPGSSPAGCPAPSTTCGRWPEVGSLDARVHERVLASADGGPLDDAALAEHVRAEAPLLGPDEVAATVARVRARIDGLGPIEPLLADPAVTDVLVNGPGPVWVERAGRLTRTDVVLDDAGIALLVERVVAPLGLRADRTAPVVDARLPDGSRVHVVLAPLAVDGPVVTIRRFGAAEVGLGAFCGPAVADLLAGAVADGLNVLVSGGTGAGKTTLLNA